VESAGGIESAVEAVREACVEAAAALPAARVGPVSAAAAMAAAPPAALVVTMLAPTGRSGGLVNDVPVPSPPLALVGMAASEDGRSGGEAVAGSTAGWSWEQRSPVSLTRALVDALRGDGAVTMRLDAVTRRPWEAAGEPEVRAELCRSDLEGLGELLTRGGWVPVCCRMPLRGGSAALLVTGWAALTAGAEPPAAAPGAARGPPSHVEAASVLARLERGSARPPPARPALRPSPPAASPGALGAQWGMVTWNTVRLEVIKAALQGLDPEREAPTTMATVTWPAGPVTVATSLVQPRTARPSYGLSIDVRVPCTREAWARVGGSPGRPGLAVRVEVIDALSADRGARVLCSGSAGMDMLPRRGRTEEWVELVGPRGEVAGRVLVRAELSGGPQPPGPWAPGGEGGAAPAATARAREPSGNDSGAAPGDEGGGVGGLGEEEARPHREAVDVRSSDGSALKALLAAQLAGLDAIRARLTGRDPALAADRAPIGAAAASEATSGAAPATAGPAADDGPVASADGDDPATAGHGLPPGDSGRPQAAGATAAGRCSPDERRSGASPGRPGEDSRAGVHAEAQPPTAGPDAGAADAPSAGPTAASAEAPGPAARPAASTEPGLSRGSAAAAAAVERTAGPGLSAVDGMPALVPSRPPRPAMPTGARDQLPRISFMQLPRGAAARSSAAMTVGSVDSSAMLGDEDARVLSILRGSD